LHSLLVNFLTDEVPGYYFFWFSPEGINAPSHFPNPAVPPPCSMTKIPLLFAPVRWCRTAGPFLVGPLIISRRGALRGCL